MATSKLNAIELLGVKIAKPKAVKPKKEVKRRKKRPIYEFIEEPVKRVDLRFLGKRFPIFVKENFSVTEHKFFELMQEKYVNAVQIGEGKIHFCRKEGTGKLQKQVTVNFNILKGKYREQVIKIIKDQPVSSDGAILSKKLVHEIMVICQSCYARGNHHDRFRMIDKSEIPKGPVERTRTLDV